MSETIARGFYEVERLGETSHLLKLPVSLDEELTAVYIMEKYRDVSTEHSPAPWRTVFTRLSRGA